MFEAYPKTRPVLPTEFAEIYAEYYKSNRTGATPATSLAQKMESWLHRRVADTKSFSLDQGQPTLEVGAGTLNQLDYEPQTAPYDIVEPFSELYAGAPNLDRVRNFYADISEVPEHLSYARITSVATLEHICNLPELVACAAKLLSDSGVFVASIPSEGTLLWKLGWQLTTGIEFRMRHGLDYGVFMRHEHVNTAAEIEAALRYFFRDVQTSVFGINRQISFYWSLECRDPDISRCDAYLASLTQTPSR